MWLYHRFCLSFREVEELLAERGVTITYEGIVKLSEFDQNLGNTRIHNSLNFRHLGYRSKVENQPNLT